MSRAERPSNLTHSDLTRRRFLQGIAGAGLTIGGVVGYTRLIEPRWLSIDKIELPIIGLPPALDGKRIAQLSDIHLCQFFSPDDLAEAVQQVEQQAPDWLMLTGDFVGDNPEDAAGLVDPLRTLTMPIFGVLGNHDCWTNRSTVSSYLAQANVQLLLNNAIQLARDFWCAGVDDLWAGHPDLSAALNDVPSNATTLLLAHEPDFFDVVLRERAPVALQLSGHSHGGQIRFPTINADPSGHYSFAPVLPRYGRQYPIGLRHVNGKYVYTNRGVGLWPIPYRFNCRPELTIFTLRST